MSKEEGRRSKCQNLLVLGTRKEVFVFEPTEGRRTWKSSGPHFKSTSIWSRTILAALDNFVKGPAIAQSNDLGRTWSERKEPSNRGNTWTLLADGLPSIFSSNTAKA